MFNLYPSDSDLISWKREPASKSIIRKLWIFKIGFELASVFGVLKAVFKKESRGTSPWSHMMELLHRNIYGSKIRRTILSARAQTLGRIFLSSMVSQVTLQRRFPQYLKHKAEARHFDCYQEVLLPSASTPTKQYLWRIAQNKNNMRARSQNSSSPAIDRPF